MLVGETIGAAHRARDRGAARDGGPLGHQPGHRRLLGAAQALLIVWLAGGLLAVGPLPRLAQAASATAAAVRAVDAYLLPPTEVIGRIAVVLDDSGLPGRVRGPRADPPGARRHPDRSAGEAIARGAIGSTFPGHDAGL